MLLFYCADKSELAVLRHEGLPTGVRLWTTLEAARPACDGPVVVIDALALDAAETLERAAPQITRRVVPPEALCNLDPYRPPRPVPAAGGYIVRSKEGAPEVLMIFRRGVWDLPKGKQDPGEDLERCAVREVGEEGGIDRVRVLRPLRPTVHGYPEGNAYCVKTTHWFLMRTPATDFTPQREEDIERVAWVPWGEARQRVGYDTLRRHMAQVEPAVLEAVNAQEGS